MTESSGALPVDLPEELIVQLIDLLDKLRDETSTFLDNPGDQQLWYNRGYANGMLITLQKVGQAKCLEPRQPDDQSALSGHLAMPWGKAYRHGESRGIEETHDITGTQTA